MQRVKAESVDCRAKRLGVDEAVRRKACFNITALLLLTENKHVFV